jgi:peroxiredoxin Q/BCP
VTREPVVGHTVRVRALHLGLAGSLVALSLALAGAAGADPKPGDRAPEFALRGSDGAEYRLSELTGRRGVVLAFFPSAFTPG